MKLLVNLIRDTLKPMYKYHLKTLTGGLWLTGGLCKQVKMNFNCMRLKIKWSVIPGSLLLIMF